MTMKSTATAIRHVDPLYQLISGGDVAIRSFEMTFDLTGDNAILDALEVETLELYLLVGDDAELVKFYQKDDTANVQGKKLPLSRENDRLKVRSEVISIASIPESTPFEFGLVYGAGVTSEQTLAGTIAIENMEVVGYTQLGTDLGQIALLVEETENSLDFDIELVHSTDNFEHQRRGYELDDQDNVVTIADGQTLSFGQVAVQAHEESGQRNELTSIAYTGDIVSQLDDTWDDIAIRLLVEGDSNIKSALIDGTLVMFVNSRYESGYLAIPSEYNFSVELREDNRLNLFMGNIPVSTIVDQGELVMSIATDSGQRITGAIQLDYVGIDGVINN